MFYYGPEGEISTAPPPDGLTCGINLYHTEAEFQVVLDAVHALVASRGMVPVMDRQEYTDEIDRSWVTRWDNQTESIRLVELKNLDGMPWGGAFDVLHLSIDR